MGGVAFVVAALAGYLAAHVRSGLVFTRTGLVVMATIVGAGVVGALDDWMPVSSPFGGEYLLHFATDGTRAFAVTGSGELLASEDGGASWALLGG